MNEPVFERPEDQKAWDNQFFCSYSITDEEELQLVRLLAEERKIKIKESIEMGAEAIARCTVSMTEATEHLGAFVKQLNDNFLNKGIVRIDV